MDFVVKNTEKTDEKMRKQESKFKQLEALTTGMINPIKNCSIKPNHWKTKHGLGREWLCFGFSTKEAACFTCGGETLPGHRLLGPRARGSKIPATAILHPARQSQGPAAYPFPILAPVFFAVSQDQEGSAEAGESLRGFTPPKPNSARQRSVTEELANQMQTRCCQKSLK